MSGGVWWRGRGPLVAVGVAVAVGAALHGWMFAGRLGALDSDEGVTGLMAIEVVHGHATAFWWGQAYGGSGEVLLTAGLFAAFGSSLVALRVVPLLLWIVATLLAWRLGRRTVGEPAATVGALLL